MDSTIEMMVKNFLQMVKRSMEQIILFKVRLNRAQLKSMLTNTNQKNIISTIKLKKIKFNKQLNLLRL